MSGGPNVIIKGGCILACGLDWPFLPPRPLPLGAALWPEDFGEGARLITDTAPPAVLEIGSSCAVRGSLVPVNASLPRVLPPRRSWLSCWRFL